MAIDLLPDELWAEAKGNARVPRRGASARRPQPIRQGVGLDLSAVAKPVTGTSDRIGWLLIIEACAHSIISSSWSIYKRPANRSQSVRACAG